MRKESIAGSVIDYLIQNALGPSEDLGTFRRRYLFIVTLKLSGNGIKEKIGILIHRFNAFPHLFLGFIVDIFTAGVESVINYFRTHIDQVVGSNELRLHNKRNKAGQHIEEIVMPQVLPGITLDHRDLKVTFVVLFFVRHESILTKEASPSKERPC